ncbi:MAG: hypothetical protein R3293_26070 [Candidatus Promineifilaceae bacterium]|nr:hypothetical protein [Candidatus Promineifilaceae bacterium]
MIRYAKLLGQLFKHTFLPSPTKGLLQQAFTWARAANPSQPLTVGLYYLRPNLGAKLNPETGKSCAAHGLMNSR